MHVDSTVLTEARQIPAILVVNRICYFFRLEITPGLLRCIERGIRPSQSTMVNVYSSLTAELSVFAVFGVYDDKELPALFKAMEAFKEFLLDSDSD